jgi:hypothetical protein
MDHWFPILNEWQDLLEIFIISSNLRKSSSLVLDNTIIVTISLELANFQLHPITSELDKQNKIICGAKQD